MQMNAGIRRPSGEVWISQNRRLSAFSRILINDLTIERKELWVHQHDVSFWEELSPAQRDWLLSCVLPKSSVPMTASGSD